MQSVDWTIPNISLAFRHPRLPFHDQITHTGHTIRSNLGRGTCYNSRLAHLARGWLEETWEMAEGERERYIRFMRPGCDGWKRTDLPLDTPPYEHHVCLLEGIAHVGQFELEF